MNHAIAPDPMKIAGYARLMLVVLRKSGADPYLRPSDIADAVFEQAQLADMGVVVAPAADVRAELQRMLECDALRLAE